MGEIRFPGPRRYGLHYKRLDCLLLEEEIVSTTCYKRWGPIIRWMTGNVAHKSKTLSTTTQPPHRKHIHSHQTLYKLNHHIENTYTVTKHYINSNSTQTTNSHLKITQNSKHKSHTIQQSQISLLNSEIGSTLDFNFEQLGVRSSLLVKS